MTDIIDGRVVAASIREEVAAAVRDLRDRGVVPMLVVVSATADDASRSYVRAIVKSAESTAIDATVVELAPDSAAGDIAEHVARAGADPLVHGVLLQTPLPPGVVAARVAEEIPVSKDVDGANPLSLGRLGSSLPSFAPATAAAVMELLRAHGIALSGRSVAVVGRSAVVGRPLAQLLVAADATVTVCHSKTRDLASVTRAADVVVAAAGRPHLLGRAHIGSGAVVIDVGTNVTPDGRVVGDVDGADVDGQASARSPVPGGVGPVTTAFLLRHVVTAAGATSPGY